MSHLTTHRITRLTAVAGIVSALAFPGAAAAERDTRAPSRAPGPIHASSSCVGTFLTCFNQCISAGGKHATWVPLDFTSTDPVGHLECWHG